MDDRDLLRYSRHLLLDEIGIEGQEKLLAATVLVIGCGGLGSAALPYLAAAGVGRLLIADHDTVSDTNLQRQVIFTEHDLERPKVEAAAERLRAINSRCEVTAINECLSEKRLIELATEADILLDCSDNFATRLAVNRASVATGTPLVSGAAVRFAGQLALFRPDLADAPCYACLFDGEEADDGACALFGVFSPLVGVIGASQAVLALNTLMGIGQVSYRQLSVYDALRGSWQQFALTKNPACPVFGGNHQQGDTA